MAWSSSSTSVRSMRVCERRQRLKAHVQSSDLYLPPLVCACACSCSDVHGRGGGRQHQQGMMDNRWEHPPLQSFHALSAATEFSVADNVGGAGTQSIFRKAPPVQNNVEYVEEEKNLHKNNIIQNHA